MNKLKAVEILDYYDYPLLFVAEDKTTQPFVCLLVNESDSLEYLVVKSSFNDIEQMKQNKKDIRSIFEHPNDNIYYSAKLNSETDEWFEITSVPQQEICGYFPERGVFLSENTVLPKQETLQSIYTTTDILSEKKNSQTFKADMTGDCEVENGDNHCTITITASNIIITINIIEVYENSDNDDQYNTIFLSDNIVETKKGDELCQIAA